MVHILLPDVDAVIGAGSKFTRLLRMPRERTAKSCGKRARNRSSKRLASDVRRSTMPERRHHAFGSAWLAWYTAAVLVAFAMPSAPRRPERTWSQGVTLARDGRVALATDRGDELELEVRVPGRPTPFEVVLNPSTTSGSATARARRRCARTWSPRCSPPSRATASCRSRRSRRRDAALPADPRSGRHRGRARARARRSHRAAAGLAAVAGREGQGRAHRDDRGRPHRRSAARRARGAASAARSSTACSSVLADARDVRWRDEPVTTSAEPVMPRAIVEDGPAGVRVRIEADPRSSARSPRSASCARADNVLRPIGAVDLAGPRLEKLPQTFDVPRSAFPELIGKTLPALAAADRRSTCARRRCRRWARARSRAWQFDVEQDGDRLRRDADAGLRRSAARARRRQHARPPQRRAADPRSRTPSAG